MEVKLNALCVRTIDYRDNDRLLSLCSVEGGKILAKIRGCKSPKSKLRFAASPFCFGEYILNSSPSGHYTVTGCSAYDCFTELTADISKYYAGFFVLEVTEKLSSEDVESTAKLVLKAVECLKELCYGDDERPEKTLIKYVKDVLAVSGYALNTDVCAVSGKPLSGNVGFDLVSGGFVNREYKTIDNVTVSAAAFHAIKDATDAGEAEASAAFRAVATILSRVTGIKLSNLDEFMRL